MPGLVVFRRRWSVGSDDLVVPGAFLFTIHIICAVTVLIALLVLPYDSAVLSTKLIWYHQLSYLLVLLLSTCTEAGICVISMRGSILDTELRSTINLWIYLKSLVMLLDITWLILGTIWLAYSYTESPAKEEKGLFIAIVVCNWTLVLVTAATIWCTFDAAGRSWVKMKKYQRSMRATESRFNYKRSNSMNRNWRQRKVIRAYQDSWDHRCRLLFCCMGSSERNRNSFTDIARLLSDFFRELDVVPSDVVAGLVLLRKFQKLEREAVVRQKKHGTYEFLSGVPITERTQFLALNDAKNYEFFQTVIHFMYFAQGAYGWPMYFMINRSRVWTLVPEMSCFGCGCGHAHDTQVIQDNCCLCNYAALKKTLQVGDTDIIYVTYHVDVGETPFFVALDYSQKKVVVSIRGTLSMKDILTDLNAEGDVLPLDPPRDDWLGHKGMVQAALYIRNKLLEEDLIEKALNRDPGRNTQTFGLVLVGHSLGAGTAAILAILMKPDYPSLQCYSYSPPGGLLSMPAVEYSKSFITSVVLGKDVVPRIGLYQMEALRSDLINAIQRSVDPKWKTISCSVICCGCGPEPTSVLEMSEKDTHINLYQEQRDTARSNSAHPIDSSIALTLHQPLFPPGRIIHIVRHHPKPDEQVLKSHEPVYQAIWAETTDFEEVLISPVMLQDHMPDKVLAALKKVVTTSGPRKPQRQSSNAFSTTSNDVNPHDAEPPISLIPTRSCSSLSHSVTLSPPTQHKLYLETSFTNLQSPASLQPYEGSSKASSVNGQMNSTQYDISSVIDDNTTLVTKRSPSVPSDSVTVIINEHESDSKEHGFRAETHQRSKAVAFDMSSDSVAMNRTPSPHEVLARGILHCQSSFRDARKPRTLQFPPLFRAPDASGQADLLHDDWIGLAPLASPETLSEISSISSRTPSASISLANSIERCLQSSTLAKDNQPKPLLDDIFESQLITPKVLRRVPKFSENLSTCAENSKNIDQYKRLGRVFITFPQILPNRETSIDSSDDTSSFQSAQSVSQQCRKESISSRTSPTSQRAGVRDNSTSSQVTLGEGQKLNRETSQENCRLTEHIHPSNTPAAVESHSAGSYDTEPQRATHCSANSAADHFRSPSNEPPVHTSHSPHDGGSAESCLTAGMLESHFPVVVPAGGSSECRARRLSSEEFIYTCNEGQPSPIVQILDNFGGPSLPTPAGSRKRRSCVYPASSGSHPKKEPRATRFRSESPTRRAVSSVGRSHESSV